MKLINIDYHRNGVSGEGFFVALVEDEGRTMLVVRYPKEDDKLIGAVLCSAFDVNLASEGNISFGSNSWRGDHYSAFMDKEIQKYNKRLDDKYNKKN